MSHPCIDRCSSVRRVCCPAGRRYRPTAAAAQQQRRTAARRSAANAGSVTLSADVGSWTQTCYANHRHRYHSTSVSLLPLAVAGSAFSQPQEVSGSHRRAAGRRCSAHHGRIHREWPRHSPFVTLLYLPHPTGLGKLALQPLVIFIVALYLAVSALSSPAVARPLISPLVWSHRPTLHGGYFCRPAPAAVAAAVASARSACRSGRSRCSQWCNVPLNGGSNYSLFAYRNCFRNDILAYR